MRVWSYKNADGIVKICGQSTDRIQVKEKDSAAHFHYDQYNRMEQMEINKSL